MEFAFLASGTGIEPDAGCVVINNAVYGVRAGDEIEISVNGHSVSLKVEAVVTDAVNSAPEAMIPYFWINEQELEDLTAGFDKGTYLVEMKTENTPETVRNFVVDYEEYLQTALFYTLSFLHGIWYDKCRQVQREAGYVIDQKRIYDRPQIGMGRKL